MATVGSHVVIAIFYGLLYWQLNHLQQDDQNAYLNRQNLFFFALTFLVVGYQDAIPAMFDSRLLFYRERGAKAYGALPYWISESFVPVVSNFIALFLFSSIVYPMAGLRVGANHFGIFFGQCLLVSFSSLFMMMSFAGCAGNANAAITFAPGGIIINVVYAGGMISIDSIPTWLSWISNFSFIRWGYQSLLHNEFSDNHHYPQGEEYYENAGLDEPGLEVSSRVNVMILLALMLFSFLTVKYINWEER